MPSHPEHRICGTLSFNGDDPPRLELIGTLGEYVPDEDRDFHPEIIIGQTITG